MELYKEIEKNLPQIEKFFSQETMLEFINTAPDELEKYNWGLGTMIRLKILRPKSALYKSFSQEGFTDRDEMAMEIIRKFHEYICMAS